MKSKEITNGKEKTYVTLDPDEFVADAYRLRGNISKDVKANSPLRYIPKIDMQSVAHQ